MHTPAPQSQSRSKFVLRNKESRQLMVYTDAQKSPDASFPLAPRGLIQVELSENQVATIRQNYGTQIQIS